MSGSRKVRNSAIRLAVFLLLVLVVKAVSDGAPDKKPSFLRKFFSPIRSVVHKSAESDSGAEESSGSDSGGSEKEPSGGSGDEAGGDEASAKGEKGASKDDAASGDEASEKGEKGASKDDAASGDEASGKGEKGASKDDAASGDEASGKGEKGASKDDAASGDEAPAKGESKDDAGSSNEAPAKGEKGESKDDAGSSAEAPTKGGKGSSKEDAPASDAEAPASGSKSKAAEGPSASADEGAPSSGKASKGTDSAASAPGGDSAAEGPSSSSSSSGSSSSASAGKATIPAGPVAFPSGATVFDVTESGAKGNGQPNMEGGGECKNAVAFIQAWKKACESTSPAKVLIPAGDFVVGQVLFTGPCKSKPIMVENKGNLLANPDLSLYPSAEWLLFENIDGLIFTGTGVVNGNGPKNWEKSSCKGKTGTSSCSPMPSSIKLHRANNTIVDGIKSVDSMFFHMFLAVVSNVTIRGVTLTAPETSPNTDGIHTSRAEGVTIYDSTIGTGDDCISIGQGSVNIKAFNVKCGPGHGISVGSLGKENEEMDVKGIHFSNCTLKGTDNGARIKTWQGKVDTVADDITYEDIIMEDVKNPIIIDTNYMAKGATEPSHVKISNINFKNIKGTASNDALVTLNCSSAVPCTAIKLDTISLKGPGTGLTSCQNAKVETVGSDGISCGK